MAEPAPPTLLDVAARAPAAAALIAGALRGGDLKSLRLAHPALRDAAGEVVTGINTQLKGPSGGAAPPARAPTARRWPALLDLTLAGPRLMDGLRALGAEPWPRLEYLCIGSQYAADGGSELGGQAARALGAAAPSLPALEQLEFTVPVSAPDLEEVLRGECRALETLEIVHFWSSESGAALPPAPAPTAQPRIRYATLGTSSGRWETDCGMARWLAARGWPLLDLEICADDAAALAALVAAPTFALQWLRLKLYHVDAPALRSLADAAWPLEGLDLWFYRKPSAAALRALAAAAWPELTSFAVSAESAYQDSEDSEEDSEEEGADSEEKALDGAAFALCPKLEELYLSYVPVGAAGVQALASQLCARLRHLELTHAQLGDDALATLSRMAWPALVCLDLSSNKLTGATLAALARGSWPALKTLNLSRNMLGDAALAALARGAWPALEVLFLSSNMLSDAALLVAACGAVPALEVLGLSHNLFCDDLIAALALREWPTLERLRLSNNPGIRAPPTLADVRRWAPAMSMYFFDI